MATLLEKKGATLQATKTGAFTTVAEEVSYSANGSTDPLLGILPNDTSHGQVTVSVTVASGAGAGTESHTFQLQDVESQKIVLRLKAASAAPSYNSGTDELEINASGVITVSVKVSGNLNCMICNPQDGSYTMNSASAIVLSGSGHVTASFPMLGQ